MRVIPATDEAIEQAGFMAGDRTDGLMNRYHRYGSAAKAGLGEPGEAGQ
jgi:hypothetical protein